ncbi:MAG TPA: DUF4124 domain-containing protein [Gammaproteobacteria bacterium]|nr:DUF4124 domain-containing protein [Gammaproteobacteria bacterium]
MKQTPRPVTLLLCIFILCIAMEPAHAGVYRWKDDNGKIVFGDTPPKDKTATAVNIDNTENSGTQFATPEQTKDIERDAKKRRYKTSSTSRQPRNKIDSHCRRYISELNKVDIYLEHTDTPRDHLKARDLRKLIKKECGNKVLTQKFDDGRCASYRRKLSKTEIFLEHTPNPRDEQQVKDLKKQIARECR